jgi:hypothetical protein
MQYRYSTRTETKLYSNWYYTDVLYEYMYLYSTYTCILYASVNPFHSFSRSTLLCIEIHPQRLHTASIPTRPLFNHVLHGNATRLSRAVHGL